MELASEPYPRRRFTADEVMRMVEIGLIRQDERVELIDGELIVVTPQGPVHSTLAAFLQACLLDAYGPGHHVRTHSPVVGTGDSIPEPDVAVVTGDFRAFTARLPGPADVKLVVEVSDSSLAIDRRKASTYAKAGYQTYWLIDVEGRRVEVRSGPSADGTYAKTEIFGEDAAIVPPGSQATLRVTDLLL